MSIRDEARKMKLASPEMAASGDERRMKALRLAGKALSDSKKEIFEANARDLSRAEEEHVSPAVKKRLIFDEGKLAAVLEGLAQLESLPDPVGRILLKRELDEGLTLTKLSCPIGVIGVIFEARPDALVQIASLCIRSGNCAILKGGRETERTNRVLFELMHQSAVEAGLPESCLLKAEQHSEIDELLSCYGDVDLLIPRGSNAFVQYIMSHTKIPVMGHADGVCHIYVDASADPGEAIPLILDAKLQYTAACNAAETLLVSRKIAPVFLPMAAKALKEQGVCLRGTKEVCNLVSAEQMGEEDFHTEYLDKILSVKIVEGVDEAVRHINAFGSHHTDAILTKDPGSAAAFTQMVDSAGVYVNCSTRFADGFRYGFGAEVGISTSKLHARGPVGLEGLMTYKYILEGEGQTVGDYAEGRKRFHFKDLI